MAITKDEVLYIANLARIKMSEEEVEKFTSQLDKILEYINKLNEIDTTEVEPLSHIEEISNVMREDRVSNESFTSKEALEMAPDKEGDFFRVPKVIE